MDLSTAFNQLGDFMTSFISWSQGNFTQFFRFSLQNWPIFFAFALFLIFCIIKGVISILNDL